MGTAPNKPSPDGLFGAVPIKHKTFVYNFTMLDQRRRRCLNVIKCFEFTGLCLEAQRYWAQIMDVSILSSWLCIICSAPNCSEVLSVECCLWYCRDIVMIVYRKRRKTMFTHSLLPSCYIFEIVVFQLLHVYISSFLDINFLKYTCLLIKNAVNSWCADIFLHKPWRPIFSIFNFQFWN